MWSKLPLNLKTILPLLVMQSTALVVGGILLISRVETVRKKETDSVVDSQADALESLVQIRGGQIAYQGNPELIQEINLDKKEFFRVESEDGFSNESSGPSKKEREGLVQALSDKKKFIERAFTIRIGDAQWRVFQVRAQKKEMQGSGSTVPVLITFALNISDELSELARIRSYTTLGSLILILLTGLATTWIVTYTTSNLHSFSESIANISPENLDWKFDSLPRSAEEKHLFATFREMFTGVKRVRETQQVFIANASHELKTPLAGIQAALEVLLSKKRKPAEYESVCSEVLKTTQSMTRLTNALLNIESLEQASTFPEPVDLKLVIASTENYLQTTTREKQLELKIETPPEDVIVSGNRELYEIAFGNILENAIKYSKKNSTIEVKLDAGVESRPQIAVRDHGIGMTQEEQKKLGQLFFKADRSRSDKASFGLGFAHALRILRAFGGNLLVDSSPQIGTQVVLQFERA